MTYQDLEENFMKTFQVFNSQEKFKVLKKNLKTHSWNDKYENNLNIVENNSRNKNKLLLSCFKLKTVDIFDLYKKNKI
jgi:hypothetical protein